MLNVNRRSQGVAASRQFEGPEWMRGMCGCMGCAARLAKEASRPPFAETQLILIDMDDYKHSISVISARIPSNLLPPITQCCMASNGSENR